MSNESFLGVDDRSGLLFRYFKGRCHGNRFRAKIAYSPALMVRAFRNGMGYRLAVERINSSTNCSTSSRKMVKIGSVVFELTQGRK